MNDSSGVHADMIKHSSLQSPLAAEGPYTCQPPASAISYALSGQGFQEDLPYSQPPEQPTRTYYRNCHTPFAPVAHQTTLPTTPPQAQYNRWSIPNSSSLLSSAWYKLQSSDIADSTRTESFELVSNGEERGNPTKASYRRYPDLSLRVPTSAADILSSSAIPSPSSPGLKSTQSPHSQPLTPISSTGDAKSPNGAKQKAKRKRASSPDSAAKTKFLRQIGSCVRCKIMKTQVRSFMLCQNIASSEQYETDNKPSAMKVTLVKSVMI